MKPSKLLSLFTGVFTALLVLSASIAVPLLCRPFYYAHIKALNLDGYTGLSVEQIKEAFDQVMDYCLGLRPDFAAGVLPFSASGASHFADVRVLFLLDLWIAVISLAALVICLSSAGNASSLPPLCWATAPASGRPLDWAACFSSWAVWPPPTLSRPLWCSTLSFSRVRPTGSLTGALIPSFCCCPRTSSATAPF